jgi:glycosyltransferase A (GT-A) superfamily protein (DUF2064 family)
VRLLTLQIDEPLPGRVLPNIAATIGETEAARLYRAIVVTTLRQLKGLRDTHIHVVCNPDDASDAIRFWLLPLLANHWQADGSIYRSDGWEILFGDACASNYQITAVGDPLCPFLCARWVHTAMLGLENSNRDTLGHSADGHRYFHAKASGETPAEETTHLPHLPVIHTDDHWQDALQSTLGPALKKAYEES